MVPEAYEPVHAAGARLLALGLYAVSLGNGRVEVLRGRYHRGPRRTHLHGGVLQVADSVERIVEGGLLRLVPRRACGFHRCTRLELLLRRLDAGDDAVHHLAKPLERSLHRHGRAARRGV